MHGVLESDNPCPCMFNFDVSFSRFNYLFQRKEKTFCKCSIIQVESICYSYITFGFVQEQRANVQASITCLPLPIPSVHVYVDKCWTRELVGGGNEKEKKKEEIVKFCSCLLSWQFEEHFQQFAYRSFYPRREKEKEPILQSLTHPSWEHLQQFTCVLLSTMGEQFLYNVDFLSNSIDQCPSFHNMPSHANSLCRCLCGQCWAHGLARGKITTK